jgi:transcriptional regulator with XRE-family HTH domain
MWGPMVDEDRIGARIAVIRKTRGWTARELAQRAHVSYSLLAKVESGAAPASPALIGAVARALRVDVPRLTGQPYDDLRGRPGACMRRLSRSGAAGNLVRA